MYDILSELPDRLFIGTYRLCKKSIEGLILLTPSYMIEPNTIAGLSIKIKVGNKHDNNDIILTLHALIDW